MNKTLERVINELTDHKAQADVLYSTSKSLSMSSHNGTIDKYKVSSSQILGVRAIKDGRVGISYTESFDDSSIKLLIKEILQNAECSEPNDLENILELSGSESDVKTYEEAEVDISIKTQKTIELETKLKALDSRVTASPYNSYTENDYYSEYLSSKGRAVTYGDKKYSVNCSALMNDGNKKAHSWDFHMAHTFNELQWDKVINNSLAQSRDVLQEKSLKTGRYSVAFSIDCLQDLIENFSNFYSAKASMDKLNPWAESIGEEVISKNLTIEDHPLYEDAFRTTKFDSEGVTRKPLKLIEDGVLKSFYHNSVTAKFYKTKTTGHAARGASSALNVSGTHLLIHGKEKKPRPSKYLEIIQIDGLRSGANYVTGNFSFGVKGYLWENGERVLTFGNCTLSGNMIELLRNVEVVGEGLVASTDQSFFSVPLMFQGISIAGA